MRILIDLSLYCCDKTCGAIEEGVGSRKHTFQLGAVFRNLHSLSLERLANLLPVSRRGGSIQQSFE
jgi:hypothetical protein